MTTEVQAVEVEDLKELRSAFAGAVIEPGDSGYEWLRRCFNALINRRPALIVRPLAVGDVAQRSSSPVNTGSRSRSAAVGTTPRGTAFLTAGSLSTSG